MSLYRVIGYHVTLSKGHMIANHPIYGCDWLSCDPLRGSHDSLSPPYKEALVPHLVATLIYFSQIYSYYIRSDRSPLTSQLTLLQPGVFFSPHGSPVNRRPPSPHPSGPSALPAWRGSVHPWQLACIHEDIAADYAGNRAYTQSVHQLCK